MVERVFPEDIGVGRQEALQRYQRLLLVWRLTRLGLYYCGDIIPLFIYILYLVCPCSQALVYTP